MGDLTFTAETHEYQLDGKKVPSVTQVLSEMGFIDTRWFTEESRERGTLVHKLCELHDLGVLDEESVDPRLAGYLAAWKSFGVKTEFVWTSVEKPLAHPLFRYAGTPDRIGISGKGIKTLIDIKSGPPSLWHCFQIGGYLAMDQCEDARTVHLSSDGSFTVEQYEIEENIFDWKAIYRTYQLKGLKR